MLLFFIGFACSNADDSGKSDSEVVDTDTTDTDTNPANSAPSAPSVAITPDHPADGDDLTVTVLTESVDPDGDAVTYRYAWSVNGTPRTDLTAASLGNTETSDGDTWEVTVTPTDGALDGPSATASVGIGNFPPSAPVIHLEPENPVYRDTITLVIDTPSVDPEGDTLTTTIKWYENDLYYASRDGLTTINGLYVDGGDEFTAVVTVSDGFNEPVSATASVVLTNLPPTITSVRVSPSSAGDDDPIVVTADADDPDGTTTFFRYVWYRDGVEATDVGDTDTVQPSFTTLGERWTVVAYGSDGHDEVSQAGSNDAIVIPWEGTSQRQVFTLTLDPDGSGGYTVVSGQWAVDYLSYGGTAGNNSCALAWAIDGSENSRYCRDCEYSFESTFTYDPGSVVEFGCTEAQTDGSGYFFFNEAYSQFNAYNTGPSLTSSASDVSLRITPESNSYSWDGTELSFLYASTSAELDEAGYVQLYMYSYASDRTYR